MQTNVNGKNGRKRRRRIIWGSIVGVVVLGAGYGVMAALRPDNKIDPSKLAVDRKSTRLNSSHIQKSRMPSSA